MKTLLLILLATSMLLASSCNRAPYRQNDLRGYHFGKGNGYSGKYHGARHRYNWEKR